MKTIKLGIVTSTLVLAFAVLATANPGIKLENDNFNFGFVPQKAKLSHTYWIKSTGSDLLKIEKVVPGCGCTKAPLAKNEIAPGDSTSLEIIFSTKTYKSRVSKSPKIYTNATTKENRVTFTANVVVDETATFPITIAPFAITKSDFNKDGNSVNFVISNESDNELSISLIDFPSDIFEVELPMKIEANSSIQGTLVLLKNKNALSFEKSVTIELDDDERTRFTIPISHPVNSLTSN